MTQAVDVQPFAQRYGPMLDQVQAALERQFGPVLWSPRTDAEVVVRDDGSFAVRVGSIHGICVPTPDLDPPAISSVVATILTRHGFTEPEPMTGSRSGHLICEAVDADGGAFTLRIKASVDARVEVAL